ncbi:MAG: hypothetical protein ABFD00_05655 [Chloroherpetonaceae bacterium]
MGLIIFADERKKDGSNKINKRISKPRERRVINIAFLRKLMGGTVRLYAIRVIPINIREKNRKSQIFPPNVNVLVSIR